MTIRKYLLMIAAIALLFLRIDSKSRAGTDGQAFSGNTTESQVSIQDSQVKDLIKKLYILAFIYVCIIFLPTWSQAMMNDQKIILPQGEHMNVADFLEQIKATGTVKAVRLILVDPYNWAFVTALDESSLNKAGCNYTTQDQKLISDMVDILRSANIKAAHGEELPKIWEPCEGIYILLANGTEVRFLFDARGAQEKIRGKFNEDLITADLSLPESLYKWASKLKVNSKCESFISRYRNK